MSFFIAEAVAQTEPTGAAQGSGIMNLVLLGGLFLFMYFMIIRPQKKKQKEIKAKAAKSVMKEIRFGPNTDDHDFDFKLKHAINFLKDGAKVKAYVHFKGRTIVYKERGEILLLKFAQALEEYAKVEQLPKLEGKRMFLFLSPKAIKK